MRLLGLLSGLALLLCAPPPCLARDAVLRRDSGGQPAAGPLATSSVAMPTAQRPASTSTMRATASHAPSPSDNSTASLLAFPAAPSGSLASSNATNSTGPGKFAKPTLTDVANSLRTRSASAVSPTFACERVGWCHAYSFWACLWFFQSSIHLVSCSSLVCAC